ncbi:MAG: hypothetical protein GY835_05860, partial [bacterium]|nr:hypothetical protein [bacterium]
MSKLTKDQQKKLLNQLADLGYGQAESEDRTLFVRRFHPFAEHVKAFDPDVVLVVGDRGTGKSELFNAVFGYQLITALARYAPDARLPPNQAGRTAWVQAHPVHKDFPDPLGLRRCLSDDETALKLWFAYLVRILEPHLDDEAIRELVAVLRPPGGSPGEVLRAFDAAQDAPLLALDRLDEKLSREDRWIFVGYDELDTVGGFDWQKMVQAIRGLTAFWAGYSRRWRRLRAKIFLRTDLFRRHADVGGADLAKLAANRAELTWSDRNLLTMLVKRIANTSEELLTYCRGSRARIRFEKPDPELGHVPDLREAEDARPLIHRMVGPYMGTDFRKGRTERWILDHLRDARGHAPPRALVRLIELAAGKERGKPRVTPPRLLHPISLRQALDDVSHDHVEQAINNEWPWFHG